MNKKELQYVDQLTGLFVLSMEGEISEDQFMKLIQILKTNPVAREYYYDFIASCVGFDQLSILSETNDTQEDQYDQQLWRELLEHEKTAPAIDLPKEEPRHELIRKVVYPQTEKRKVTKFQVFTLVMSAAAVLFFVFFIRFIPVKQSRTEVATLTDSINAKWADVGISMEKGVRLYNDKTPFLLREGLVELKFDNNTRVTIEGPTELQILDSDMIKLNYGRLYATVPTEAIGFTVSTRTTRIIDLGTEFGVEADPHGNTDLHVIKGRTTLIAGLRKGDKQAHDVLAGAAMRVNPNLEIRNIEHKENLFARSINSQTSFVWRGGNVSLASMAAGHDGFREVGSLIGLDPVKGKLVTSISHQWRRSNNAYNLVPDLRFIDGVFVPDGEAGAIQVTSSGHTFDCPDTSGLFTHEIAAYRGSIAKQNTTIPPVMINGEEVINEPILMLHSNSGITFDLQAIRESLPQLDLKSLKATGIPITESKIADYVFWILIDGQIKYEKTVVTMDSKDPIPVHVEFTPADRFLTLIVTDGLRAADEENEYVYANDFFYLIKPELCLTDRMQR